MRRRRIARKAVKTAIIAKAAHRLGRRGKAPGQALTRRAIRGLGPSPEA
jgi:hypothetical protein